MENLSYTFVTSLDEADKALTSDVFLVSQLSSDSHYLSKKLPYSKLCSLILVDVDSKIDDRLNEVILELSTKVDVSIEDIQFLSSQIDNCITAIVKIANCVQVNKADIKYLSSVLSANNLNNLSFTNGLSSYKSGVKTYIGHSAKKMTGGKSTSFLKVGYDEYGHISASANVTKADLTSLGVPDHDTTYGIANTSNLGLLKLKSGTYTQTDRYKLELESNGNAYVDVPVEQKINDKIVPASEDQLGVVALCNTLQNKMRSDGFDNVEICHPLKMYANKYAYVEVPLASGGNNNLDSGTKAVANEHYVISAIHYGSGGITGIDSSTYLYDELYGVSCVVENECLTKENTTLRVTKDGPKSILILSRGDEEICRVNGSELLDNSAEIDVSASVLKSYYTYEDDENPTFHDKPAIEVKTTIDGIQTCNYGEIPYEDWIFTLDDGTSVNKRVITYTI